MNSRVSKILGAPLLAALVATALVAAPAQAANPVTINSLSELEDAFLDGGAYQLGKNLLVSNNAENPVVASTTDEVTLDLNGYMLRLQSASTGPALQIEGDAHVTLTDTRGGGKLEAIGFDRQAAAIGTREGASSAGKLTVAGAEVVAAMILGAGQVQNAATVGGGRLVEGLHLVVESGSLQATSTEDSNGPAIGSGGNASGGVVAVNGGTLEGLSKGKGAGIGGAFYSDGLNLVQIRGGTVTGSAVTGAAGIGGGQYGNGGSTVLVAGGRVLANGGTNGAGIGGGESGNAATNVALTGGYVEATGGTSASGIGGGKFGNGGAVYVSGARINVRGGESASSIGAGAQASSSAVERGTLAIGGSANETPPTHAPGPYGALMSVNTSSAVPFQMTNSQSGAYVQTVIDFSHVVTFSVAGGGPIPPVQYVYNGDLVDEPQAPTRNNYTFLGWFDGAAPFNFAEEVTEDVDLVAKWELHAYDASYDVTFDSNGGSAVSPQSVDYGDTATKPTTPTRRGYEFVAWQSGGTNYNFGSSVTGPLTLTAKWKQNAAVPFIDVSSNTNSVYYSQFDHEINWLARAGISKGWNVGNGKFEYRPYDEITREAMAAFMYRFAGSPAVSLPSKSPFSDVTPSNTNFYKEIIWMNQQGISTGWHMSNGKHEFRPKDEITRDAMAAFMYRFAGKPAHTPPSTSPFTDLPKSSQFYREVTWLANTGISKGWTMGGGKYEYRPYDEITRDAMAAFMYRFDKI